MIKLCMPALIYVVFSLVQIIADTFNGLYNTAGFKSIIMIIITILLNTLCQSQMGIIAWILVFIPFIFMSVIVTILLYIFGLNPETGQISLKCSDDKSLGGNLIYSSAIDDVTINYNTPSEDSYITTTSVPVMSSDPQYE